MNETTLTAVRTRAPGKLVLVGEYAVIDGGSAWVTAVDRFVNVTVTPGEPSLSVLAPEKQNVALAYSDGVWQTDAKWTLAATALTEAFQANLPHVTVDSRAFYLAGPAGAEKAGFGGSAAVVAALLLAGRYGGLDPHTLMAVARDVHHRAQGGLGSGIDIAASVYGGSFVYRLDQGTPRVKRLGIPASVALTAVWMGTSASTPKLVRRVMDYKFESPGEYEILIDKLRLTAKEALRHAERNDVLGLFDALEEYGRRMAQLGRSAGVPIVTPAMETLAGKLAGDAAVKPSGAGGGDIVLAFHRPDKAATVAQKIQQAGFSVVPLAFGAPGAARADQR